MCYAVVGECDLRRALRKRLAGSLHRMEAWAIQRLTKSTFSVHWWPSVNPRLRLLEALDSEALTSYPIAAQVSRLFILSAKW